MGNATVRDSGNQLHSWRARDYLIKTKKRKTARDKHRGEDAFKQEFDMFSDLDSLYNWF